MNNIDGEEKEAVIFLIEGFISAQIKVSSDKISDLEQIIIQTKERMAAEYVRKKRSENDFVKLQNYIVRLRIKKYTLTQFIAEVRCHLNKEEKP